jgi:hypothetical protein
LGALEAAGAVDCLAMKDFPRFILKNLPVLADLSVIRAFVRSRFRCKITHRQKSRRGKIIAKRIPITLPIGTKASPAEIEKAFVARTAVPDWCRLISDSCLTVYTEQA